MEQENKAAGYYYYAAADRYIIDTKHYIERFYDRERFKQDAGSEDLRLSLIKAIRSGIDQIMTRYGDRRGSYLIHSKSRRVSAVIAWGPPPPNFPYKNYKTRNHASIITVPPLKSDPHKKPQDTMISVASPEGEHIIIKQGSEIITDLILIEVQ